MLNVVPKQHQRFSTTLLGTTFKYKKHRHEIMFERTKTVNGLKYKYLVKSVRIGGKVRQKTIKYLGKMPEENEPPEIKSKGKSCPIKDTKPKRANEIEGCGNVMEWVSIDIEKTVLDRLMEHDCCGWGESDVIETLVNEKESGLYLPHGLYYFGTSKTSPLPCESKKHADAFFEVIRAIDPNMRQMNYIDMAKTERKDYPIPYLGFPPSTVFEVTDKYISDYCSFEDWIESKYEDPKAKELLAAIEAKRIELDQQGQKRKKGKTL